MNAMNAMNAMNTMSTMNTMNTMNKMNVVNAYFTYVVRSSQSVNPAGGFEVFFLFCKEKVARFFSKCRK